MKNLRKAMGESTSTLARNVSCLSSVERTETGLDVLKCSFKIDSAPLQHSYFEQWCEIKPKGECFWKFKAFPSKA
jgi:hypothetical protein